MGTLYDEKWVMSPTSVQKHKQSKGNRPLVGKELDKPFMENSKEERDMCFHSKEGSINSQTRKEEINHASLNIRSPKKSNEAKEKEFKKFLDMFIKLEINLPFVEALAYMPKYAKFLIQPMDAKKKLGEIKEVTLKLKCCVVIQNGLPRKCEDPRV